MLTLRHATNLPSVGLSGFELPLSEEESAIQSTVHRFSKDVLRPVGIILDRMSAEQVASPGSPFFEVLQSFAQLGFDTEVLSSLAPQSACNVESLLAEEMGWGDSGLAIALAGAGFPGQVAAALANDELIGLCAGRIGCWLITHPDKGSDGTILDFNRDWPAGERGNRGNVWASVKADELVINGQSSAWVSNGPVAGVALAYLTADYGEGVYNPDGSVRGVTAIIPLDLPGVSRGRPLDKIGQRSLPQGEIFFDNVRVPRRFVIAEQDEYAGNLASIWSYAGAHMAQVFTGVARAAFELALAYCHERKHGGRPLIEHQLTRYRIGDMLRRVEMARAIARRSLTYARLSPQSHPYVIASAKVSATEEAMTVVNEAFQLFGGAATSREYPIEKLFRDTRSSLIEDGENRVLTMRLGLLCQQLYAEGWTQ